MEQIILVGLTEAQLRAIFHALVEERDRVASAGGSCYGPLMLPELSALIEKLDSQLALFGMDYLRPRSRYLKAA